MEKMIDFSIRSHTQDFFSGLSGLDVGKKIDEIILENPNTLIRVSMYGIENFSPSFINGAFLYIIDLYGADYFREFIKITQISQALLPQLKSDIDRHIQQKKLFFENLKTNKIFVAIDGSEESFEIRNKIYVGVANQVQFLYSSRNNFDQDTQQKISLADFFIGFWINEKDTIIREQINYAISKNKHCLLFCDKDFYLKIPDQIKNKVQVIRFEESGLLSMTRSINELILSKKVNNAANAVALGLLGAAGAVLLAAFLGRK